MLGKIHSEKTSVAKLSQTIVQTCTFVSKFYKLYPNFVVILRYTG